MSKRLGTALLMTSQVARILGVSSETVRQMTRDGRLKAAKTANGDRLYEPRVVNALTVDRAVEEAVREVLGR